MNVRTRREIDGEPGLVEAKRREETRSCVHNERCEPRVSREGNIPQTLKKYALNCYEGTGCSSKTSAPPKGRPDPFRDLEKG